MKEHYLHYLWKHKMLPFHRLHIGDWKGFKVIHPGTHNENESGPDFSNAILEIDGIKWFGSVEIHVNAKDWYNHKHHKDSSYNNVILHVVYNGDEKVIQNGWEIPQIQLKEIIDKEHYEFYSAISKPKQSILCANQLKHVPQSIIEELMHERMEQRLFRKNEITNICFNGVTSEKISFYLMASAMGTKINKLPFEELANRLCSTKLAKLPFPERLALIKMVSGLHQPQNADEILLLRKFNHTYRQREFTVMSTSSWKTKGMRCRDWFNLRMDQFALVAGILSHVDQIMTNPANEMVKIFKSLIEKEITRANQKISFTDQFINHLMINWIAPYMFWSATKKQELNTDFRDDLKSKALQLLSMLKPEKNCIIDQWERYGLKVNNAGESQSLLENYNEFCIQKKCLTCVVGKYLLS